MPQREQRDRDRRQAQGRDDRPQLPPLIKAQFRNIQEKVEVLKVKRRLAASDKFSRAWMRSSKPHAERVADMNNRLLLGLLQGGDQYTVTSHGKIVKKTAQANAQDTETQLINENLTFLSWNVNGWYRDTKAIKSQIICGIGPDFVAISETHLKDSEEIEIPGYLCITNSRRLRNVRARRNSGGVCLLFKDCILSKYKYEIIDKCYDGILAVKFTRTQDLYNFVIICLYLPPEQTSWGRNASAFYAHVMQIIYENSYCDDIILAGDLNSKIGDMPDYVMEVDSDVHPRKALDKTINRHGKELVEFLIQSKFVACNGRITPENDNFTFVHSRGKSIIDYIMVPIDSIQKCLKFCVCPPRDLTMKKQRNVFWS